MKQLNNAALQIINMKKKEEFFFFLDFRIRELNICSINMREGGGERDFSLFISQFLLPPLLHPEQFYFWQDISCLWSSVLFW